MGKRSEPSVVVMTTFHTGIPFVSYDGRSFFLVVVPIHSGLEFDPPPCGCFSNRQHEWTVSVVDENLSVRGHKEMAGLRSRLKQI